ncbi:iron-siderophore ABC transporter substrate-binding protein [Corynebacterium sphenisci]|uniref:iron-siderophore ABC transporter substrate-binding protein n=1 Tax=Corynebacterium sphenisci TaxID=191493 RepID=UPI0026E0C35D|nr:iron-siderophore ABC transporter substrate-binding protein [Corynebacterium sphenisci]MDO5730557.1 iron-siderophore ABC transporter substrate-binding protein [Corynebacterium sphenisci]
MRIGKRIAAVGATIVMACGLGLAGCSGDGGDTADATAAVEVEEGAFPVTIEHVFGETTIEEAPTRVAALGETDVDPLLALGVTPVWVRGWTDEGPNEWQQPLVDGDPLWFNEEETDFESIAAQNPDLIIAQYADLEPGQYEKLSDIAPVVAYAEETGGYNQSWQDTTRTIGKAVGKPKAAEKLVTDLEQRIAQVAEEHPDWAGKEALVVRPDLEELVAYTEDDVSNRLLSDFGFEFPAEVEALGDGTESIYMSWERANLIDRDLVVWECFDCTLSGDAPDPEGKVITDDPILGKLKVVSEGRSFAINDVLDEDEHTAMMWSTVLSIDHFLDAYVAAIEETIGT